MDEARIGQTGRNGRRWYQRGVRPIGLRDHRHEAVYLFGAACPERDAACGLVLPVVSTEAMQLFLDELSGHVATDAHALVIMDKAGWHIAHDLVIPLNITPIFLPSYSPELNPIERLWLYLKEHFLSHRLWPTYDDVVTAVCQAWNRTIHEPGRISSLCHAEWAATVKN